MRLPLVLALVLGVTGLADAEKTAPIHVVYDAQHLDLEKHVLQFKPSRAIAEATLSVIGVAATTLSFHLKELANAGLVTQQRDGRNLIYRAAYAQMNDVLAYLTAHCCQGEACLVTQARACC